MKINFSFKQMIILSFLFLSAIGLHAQEKKVAPTSQSLYDEIAKMDSILFTEFNAKHFEAFKKYFTNDLEWFQDNDGLISYDKVFENFEKMFKNENRLTRELQKGSLEVHPLKNYGAIEIGTHRFRHMENGKEEIGNFKFLMIWQKNDGEWKISRVVSYDH